MNTRCGMKKKKNTTRWLAILIIVALTISSIVLPGSGISARADNLDDKTVSVENLDEESANKENLTSDTDDKENLNNNITDNEALDSKITDDKNLKSEIIENDNKNISAVENEGINNNTSDKSNLESKTDDNKKLNNNTSDNNNSESKTVDENQNINTINNEKLDSNSVNNNENINTINNEKLDSSPVNNSQNINTINNENQVTESVNTYNSNKQSTVNSSISTLSEEGIQLYANNSVNVDAEYFYEIDMVATSTNEHYIAKGIYVDDKGNAHIVLGFQKNNNWKEVLKVKVGDKEVIGPNYNVILGSNSSKASIVITLPNGEIKTLESNLGLMDIEIGEIEKITEIFYFAIDTTTSGEYWTGWDLPGATITITLDYSIVKDIVKDGVVIKEPNVKVGDEITYKVTITNNSEIPLKELEVTDDVPEGLIVTKIDGEETEESNRTGKITIDENVTLAKAGDEGSSRSYLVTAIVSNSTLPGEIHNVATMGSKYILPKSDYADAYLTQSLTIQKIVAGNMGETTRKFDFTAEVYKDSVKQETINFQLQHKESKAITGLTRNSSIKLSEIIPSESQYVVTVTVNGTKQEAVDGVYTINLSDYTDSDINIVVTNTKNILIDTGILLDSMPYILILGVVIIGGTIFFINRRKQQKNN